MKKKVLLSFYSTQQIGGPNNAMRRLMDSELKNKYDFIPITINEHLGKMPQLKVLKRLVNEIKYENPDVIYYTGMQLQGFYMAVASWLAGYKNKTIMVVRGSSCDAIHVSSVFRGIFRYFIEPITVRLTRITHTVCNEMAENPIVKNNVVHFGGIIHNAAPRIENIYKREIFRNEMGLLDTDIALVYTGRIIEDKGITYLMEAMQRTDEYIKLFLVGDGNVEEYKKLRNSLGIKKKVCFLGKRNDILKILAGSDIFVFPTLHENLSNSVLEACSMKLPVIATDVGGNPEIIRNEVEGILIHSKESGELAKAINKLAKDEKFRKKLGENAYLRMQTEFSQTNIYEKVERLFDEIISENNLK